MEIKNVKGTHDIIAPESNTYTYVEELMKGIARLFAFNELRPPVLEHSELFVRGVGESSDVVRKEMYTFLDKGGRSLTLRPEFTAGIVRLIVQNKLLNTNELPYKAFYLGPLFRYERPQLGRYRQFNQFGVEAIGNSNPLCDIEVITLAYTILQSLSLENVKVKINTLGDAESRENYKKALKEFFASHIENMCPDCQNRFTLNPLRILDCKVKEDQEIVKNAPKMNEFLSDAAKERFQFILDTLDDLQIPYEVDTSLVRGLDYYSQTVFEFHYTSKKGNNYGAIGGGGYYDKLVKELGGTDVPGVGFSFGVERIVSVLTDDDLIPPEVQDNLDFYVMSLNQDCDIYATMAANALRMMGLKVDFCFDHIKMNSMFKRAASKNAKYAMIIGEDEVRNYTVIIKNLITKEQNVIKNDELYEFISSLNKEEENHHGCSCDHEHEGDACQHHHKEGECCCGKGHK